MTVLFPFVAPADVDATVLERLQEALAGVAPFDCVLDRTAWFGEDVLYLAPRPEEPFRALTEAVWRAFPDRPPYAGAHPDVVPHLTVGHAPPAPPTELREAEAAVLPMLPVRTRVDRVHLLGGTDEPGSWRVLHAFTLRA